MTTDTVTASGRALKRSAACVWRVESMPKRKENKPNRLLQSGYMVLSTEPLVGVIVMETDEGVLDVAVNRSVAEELLENVQMFLEGKKSPHQ